VDRRRGDHSAWRGWGRAGEWWGWRRRLGCFPRRGAMLVGVKSRGEEEMEGMTSGPGLAATVGGSMAFSSRRGEMELGRPTCWAARTSGRARRARPLACLG
jgi:hypothetical protein